MIKQIQTKFCGMIFTEHICSVGEIYYIRLMVMYRIRITIFWFNNHTLSRSFDRLRVCFLVSTF